MLTFGFEGILSNLVRGAVALSRYYGRWWNFGLNLTDP